MELEVVDNDVDTAVSRYLNPYKILGNERELMEIGWETLGVKRKSFGHQRECKLVCIGVLRAYSYKNFSLTSAYPTV